MSNFLGSLHCAVLGCFTSDDVSEDYKLSDGVETESLSQGLSLIRANGGWRRPNCYWADEGSPEVNFIVQRERKIISVGVKSSEYTREIGLEAYQKLYYSDCALRTSAKSFGAEGGIKSVPLYAAFQI